MNEKLEKLGYIARYNSAGELVNNEVLPLALVLERLSNVAEGFAIAAENVSNINITELHQIKELLEVVYDARRLAQKVQCVLDERAEVALRAIRTGVYDFDNLVNGIEQNVPNQTTGGKGVSVGVDNVNIVIPEPTKKGKNKEDTKIVPEIKKE